jgi:ppGpp synthetase/RelA/SpoT-type nucleotidyltranferase
VSCSTIWERMADIPTIGYTVRQAPEASSQAMTDNNPTASFIAQYRREYDFYYEVAQLVSQRCDSLATENGIRAIVTFRAKSPERLKEKLAQRNPDKNYQSEVDIRADIVDLSGVRIALYFPGDRAKIAALLRTSFIVDRGSGKIVSR